MERCAFGELLLGDAQDVAVRSDSSSDRGDQGLVYSSWHGENLARIPRRLHDHYTVLGTRSSNLEALAVDTGVS